MLGGPETPMPVRSGRSGRSQRDVLVTCRDYTGLGVRSTSQEGLTLLRRLWDNNVTAHPGGIDG